MSNWISGNYHLGGSATEHNAKIVTTYFIMYGATTESISALLGNMQVESGINPGIWENLDPYAGGYGLVQWTPYTKYSEWAGDGWENNGDKQVMRIFYEVEHGLQWIKTQSYPLTFKEFLHSKDNPRWLAQAFCRNYERPDASLDQTLRSDYAEGWYNKIKGAVNPWYIFLRKKGRHGIRWL